MTSETPNYFVTKYPPNPDDRIYLDSSQYIPRNVRQSLASALELASFFSHDTQKCLKYCNEFRYSGNTQCFSIQKREKVKLILTKVADHVFAKQINISLLEKCQKTRKLLSCRLQISKRFPHQEIFLLNA